MTLRLVWWSAIVVSLAGAVDRADAQSLPKELKEWTLEYGLSGGIAGIMRHVSVSQDGAVGVDDKAGDTHLTGRAPDDLIAKIAVTLKTARDLKPSTARRAPMPDQMDGWLSITTGGREYPLEVTSVIVDLMEEAANIAEKKAVVGTWGQTGWKLCKPAAQLAPSGTDPPVDALVFKPDGTFSVTWRGGGAHTTGVPHVDIPDYQGRYEVSPKSGSIQMRIEGGLFVPADFSGQGSFRLSANQLTLRNVWLGTRRATQKPDVCELTFSK
jgi:hypothetical protein